MPTLFCKPENNLANRLITICSSYRIARKLGYEFVLVWETDRDKSATFSECFSKFFIPEFEITKKVPLGSTTYAPHRRREPRSTIEPLNGHHDLLFDRWFHFERLSDEDSLSNEDLTADIRGVAREILRPTRDTELLAEYFGYSDLEPQLAVHIRTGAWVIDGVTPSFVTTASAMAALSMTVLRERGFKEVFVCGSDPALNFQLGSLISNSIGDINVTCSRACSFEISFINHGLAVLDFLTISKARAVINSGVSTFSAFASLVGESDLSTFIDERRYLSRRSVIGSGLGL